MSVNVTKGVFRCHGCEYQGNAYTYLITNRGMDKKDALKLLKEQGWDEARIKVAQNQQRDIDNSKKGRPKWSEQTWDKLRGRPKIAEHDYCTEDGTLVTRLIRYATEEKLKGPKCLPFSPCKEGGWWCCYALSDDLPTEDKLVDKLPLYRLPELMESMTRSPGRQIWIVEGEKCVDAVLSLKDIGADGPPPCTTAMFGQLESFEKNDLSPLEGKTILLMADQDDPGRAKMLKLAAHLAGNFGCAVKTFLPPGDAEPRAKGYDVADAIMAGGWDSVLQWVREVGSPQTYAFPKRAVQETLYLSPMDETDHFKVRGLHGTDYVAIQSKATHEVHVIKRTSLNIEGTLLMMAPLGWWVEKSEGNGIGPAARRSFADAILRAAEARGHFKLENLVGRGASKDGSKYSYNIGEKVLTEGDDGLLSVETDIGHADGYFQPGAHISMRDVPEAPLYAKELYDAVMAYRWQSPIDGRAFLGWIVSAIVGGALPFRPMLWLLAPASSGKTFLLTNVLSPALRTMLFPLIDASEAGIVSALGGDSLACYLDEFEPRKGQEQKWESILAVVRMATSGDGARLRGSPTNTMTIMHRPRFSMLVASTHRPSLSAADDSRFFTIRLSAQMVDDWPKVRRDVESATDPDKMLALRSYIIRNTANIVNKAQEIEDELLTSVSGISTREAMISGALTAGAGFLSGDYRMVRRRRGTKDDTFTIFSRLLSALVRTHEGSEMSIAEILRKGYWDKFGTFIWDGFDKEYVNLASRYGFRMATEQTIFVGTDLESQKSLLRRSEFENVDLTDYFRRLPGVSKVVTHKGGTRRLRFGDMQRVTYVADRNACESAGFAIKEEEQALEPEEFEASEQEDTELGTEVPF